MSKPVNILEILSSKSKKVGDCIEWTGAKNAKGYGQMTVLGKCKKVHRLSYELSNGAIPEGNLVCHTCDNPSCINPKHLFLGSIAINNADRMTKGRYSKNTASHCKHGHEFTEANTKVYNGYRSCRKCNAAVTAKYLANKKTTKS